MRKIGLAVLMGGLMSFSAAAIEQNESFGRVGRLLMPLPENFIGFSAYEPNYFTQTYSNKNFTEQQGMQSNEVKFQLSVALPVWKGILGENSVLALAYTQKSWFQMANLKQSSPFREHNYKPRAFIGWQLQRDLGLGWQLNEIESGFVHESNGKGTGENSRHWNRLYARFSATQGNWTVTLKPWCRLPERKNKDENRDIQRYRSYFDMGVVYRNDKHQAKVEGHYNPTSNKGGIELSYSYALNRYLSVYTQYYVGYGESLIDYNRHIKRIGLGFSLSNVF